MKPRFIRPSDPPPTYETHRREKMKRARRLAQNRRHKSR